jgi:phosphohistidine phosphatase
MSQADNLAPMDDPGGWAGRVAEMNEEVMLVGHLPHLAKLAGLLLCGDKEKAPIDFKMGGIVCLKRFDDNRWAVEWMIVPEMVG